MADVTTPANNAEIRAHQAWLGLLEGYRAGIVVSPPALAAAGVNLDTDAIAAQNALLALLTREGQGKERGPDDGPPGDKEREAARARDADRAFREAVRGLRETIAERWGEDGDVVLPALGPFCEAVLGWRASDLLPVEAGDARFSTYLREQNETLSPTHVVMDGDTPLLLVREEARNLDLDALPPERAGAVGWHASPEVRFERILRDARVPLGILFNGSVLRLVYAPAEETAGHLTFPVRAMCEVAGRRILAALVMLLHQDRLFTGPRAARLPALVVESRKYQSTVSTKLAGQVLDALHALVRGFQAANEADPRGRGELLRGVIDDPAGRAHVYGGLLTTLMRLVFVLYAEDRELLPTSGIYPGSYSLTGLFARLREDAGRYPDTMDARFGAWAQLLTLFRVLHDGARAADMHLPARAGRLFDPDAYPFLEGRVRDVRRVKGERLTPPLVSDGVIHRVLGLLLYLDGDRLSYRSLEVQQIGSVYEAMMGFTLEQAKGRSIAVLPDHVVIDLEETARLGEAARDKRLAETGCKLADAAQKAWRAAKDEAGLLAALERRTSPRTPDVLTAESLYLQPTEERRRSGSHYTPPELTGPIVATTLKPQLDALGGGKVPLPEQVLGLKVCDPAMGSGAFLVEACSSLGRALVAAWEEHKCVPVIPPDEDLTLHARRLVAQRCLYGVDKNPFAVDLAKLSLWLFTLARDQPFTFLDHALRQGDSLVGLSREQTASFDWKSEAGRAGMQLSLLRPMVRDVMEKVVAKRAEIHALGDSPDVAAKARIHRDAEDLVQDVRSIANLALVAFFSEKKDAAREKHRKRLVDTVVNAYLGGRLEGRALETQADELKALSPPVSPFHWELEFPEVFARENPGFDAFVGNPPFMGGTMISTSGGSNYLDWLTKTNVDSGNRMDLVAYFFRRSFGLLRSRGTLGLIATNTIAQGDTRSGGLSWICRHGGVIFDATRRYKWPGLAAVIVSIVHISKGGLDGLAIRLDGRAVPRLTAFLLDRGVDETPTPLLANCDMSFEGYKIAGQGFLFADGEKGATPLARMRELLSTNSRNAERIFPYIGGEELNSSPTQAHHRYAISFGRMPEEEAREWPDLFAIVETKVRPERAQSKRDAHRLRWWQYGETRPGLTARIATKSRVLACSLVSKYLGFAWLPSTYVCSHKLAVFAFASDAAFGILQSRVHEVFALFFSSTLEDRMNYSPSDCFETFPFPENWQESPTLEAAGKAYYDFRAALMVQNDEGLTKTYNRFHDPDERSPQIHKLRELHAAMDRAVLDAYGFTDVPTDCQFLLDHDDGATEDEEAGKKRKKKPWRYRFPDDVRDDVLARLIELNRTRAEDERRRGLTVARPAKRPDDDPDDPDAGD